MNVTTKQYNYCLDFLKGVACVFVVFMHCEFPGIMGVAVQAISRFCVPFFFMISGYFCFRPVVCINNGEAPVSGNEAMIRRKVIHIGKITLYACLFYLVFVLLQQLFFHNQDFAITRRALFNWVVFNQPLIVAGQYWFLFALLYAYIFYGLLEKLKLHRFSYILAAFMFMCYVVLAQGMHLAGNRIPNMYYRNWFVEAFPFFMLGHWIHEHQDRIDISNKSLIIIIVLTTLLCWVERYLMGRDFGVNIITMPQVFALFIYGVKNLTRHEGIIQRLGRNCSMLVYIFHPAVWLSLDGVYSKVGISGNLTALYVKPVLVLGVSIVMSLMFNYVVSSFNARKQLSNAF